VPPLPARQSVQSYSTLPSGGDAFLHFEAVHVPGDL
jgi:hypothetical protein